MRGLAWGKIGLDRKLIAPSEIGNLGDRQNLAGMSYLDLQLGTSKIEGRRISEYETGNREKCQTKDTHP